MPTDKPLTTTQVTNEVPVSFTSGFSALDVAVVAVPLLMAVGLALYMRRFNRSVADFLAANRSAGRYLICTAQMEMGMTAMGVVAAMEVFSKTGFSLNIFSAFIGFTYFLLALSGLITFRFRETRALTFHQFFELRYSKGVRIYATFLNIFSGLFTFGLAPGVAARFFVYFLGLPTECDFLGIHMQTFIPVMITLMGMAMFFAMSGGHLSVMMVDCLEGVISSVLYLVVAVAVLLIFSHTQMVEAFCSGLPGASYVDPMDVAKQKDFGYAYVLIAWAMSLYFWRGNAWNAAFAASARTAHEGQMATIIGVWRSMGAIAMGTVISIGAFVLLHHADFAGQAQAVQTHLTNTIPEVDKQLRVQLALPTAMGSLLPIGVKGALCAIMLMGTIAGLSSSLFGFSTGFVQDVILPIRGRHMEPRIHIRSLRIAAVGLAVFSIWFSTVFHFADYINMIMNLLSGIYLAGIGAVVWGGLYWSRATKTGAWVSLLTGSILALTGSVLQQVWPALAKWGSSAFASGMLHNLLANNPDNMPVNGQILTACIMALSLTLFIVVSLLTCRQPHDMDKMLHRGEWGLPNDEQEPSIRKSSRFSLQMLAGINNPNFTRGDRIIAYGVFFFGIVSPITSVYALGWNACISRWSANGWFNWHFFWSVCVPLAVSLITFVWFTWGSTRDMLRLIRDLRVEKIDENDDGLVKEEEKPLN